jgi:hypothetical protein
MMNLTRSRTLRFALAGVLAACALDAAPPAFADTTACAAPALTQPFRSWGDAHWYAQPADEGDGGLDGAGWTLAGGASIKATRLADGTTGQVLDLPSGAYAISPEMCVDSSYPTARTMVRNVVGSEGVYFYVVFPDRAAWKNTGQVHGAKQSVWTLSTPVTLQTSGLSGGQPARFGFVAGGKTSEFQIYDFYVDPYSRG